MPEPTETIPDVVQLSRESMATMEKEAQALFDQQDSARINPAPAPEPPPKKEAPPAPEPVKPDAGLKVAGPPRIQTPGKTETPSTQQPDFSDIPKEYTPGQIKGEQWKKLHAKADHFAQLHEQTAKRQKELESELERSKGNGQLSAEAQKMLDDIRKERDELQARLEAVAVTESPRFQQGYKPRVEAALSLAKEAVGPDKAKDIEQLLMTPRSRYRDQQLEAIANELPLLQRDDLLSAARTLTQIDLEKEGMKKQGSEIFKQWTAEAQAAQQRQQQERQQQASSAFDGELNAWKSAMPDLADEEVSRAKDVFSGNGMTYKDMANAAMWGVVGPKLAASLSQERQQSAAKIAELESELTRLRGAQPGIKPEGGAPLSEEPTNEEPTSTSYIERIAQMAISEGALKR